MSKLFVSLPMRFRNDIDIYNEMYALKNLIEENTGEEFELIDTLDVSEAPDYIVNDCWFLGQSITKLSQADLVVFSPHWTRATGCIIEHMVCAFYDIPYVDVRLDDFMDFEDEEFDEIEEEEKDSHDDYDSDTVDETIEENDISKDEPETPATESE